MTITKDRFWNAVLIVEAIIIVVGLGYIITRPAPPCTESLDYYPNFPDHGNFGQPILTKHNCTEGQIPVNWRDFEPKGGSN